MSQDHVIGETELYHPSGGFRNLVGRSPWLTFHIVARLQYFLNWAVNINHSTKSIILLVEKQPVLHIRITYITSIFFKKKCRYKILIA